MLTEEEQREIKSHLDEYPTRRAACVEALKIVQRERGWISDASLEEVADLLEMTVQELDSIATFYNLIYRKPVGEHVVLLCDSVSCWVMGFEEIRRAIRDELGIDFGKTTDDDQFTLLPICCLGDCDRAPAMMVDEDTHDDLTPQKVVDILSQYRAK